MIFVILGKNHLTKYKSFPNITVVYYFIKNKMKIV